MGTFHLWSVGPGSGWAHFISGLWGRAVYGHISVELYHIILYCIIFYHLVIDSLTLVFKIIYVKCSRKPCHSSSAILSLINTNSTQPSLSAKSSWSWTTAIGRHQMHFTVNHLHLLNLLIFHTILGHEWVDMFYS